jgi:UDP-galactopyranose mutase
MYNPTRETPIDYIPEKTEPYYPVNDAKNTEILKNTKKKRLNKINLYSVEDLVNTTIMIWIR